MLSRMTTGELTRFHWPRCPLPYSMLEQLALTVGTLNCGQCGVSGWDASIVSMQWVPGDRTLYLNLECDFCGRRGGAKLTYES